MNEFFLSPEPCSQMIAPRSVDALKRRFVYGCQSNELIILKCSFNVQIFTHLEISGLPYVSNIHISLFNGQIATNVASPFQAKHCIPGKMRFPDY